MIDVEKKEAILEQVGTFYKDTLKEIQKARYYVDTDSAKDIAAFFGKIYQDSDYSFNRVIDLTFGSANLTSHILLDNNINFETLILNDINIKDANRNVELGEKWNLDILDYDSFQKVEPFDLVIFNPQLGGTSYSAGKLKIDSGLNKDSFCIHKLHLDIEEALRDKFNLSDCEVIINPDGKNEHKIFIYSYKLTNSQMNNRFGKLQIFNYYDVFFQAKGEEEHGQFSETVKFRKTLEKITHNKTIVVFLGNEKDYNNFFADFNHYFKYNTKIDKSIFIASKEAESKKECYERNDNDFIVIDCNKQNIDEISLNDIDLFELLDDISNDLTNLKNLNGSELGIETSNAVLKTKEYKTERINEKHKPFQNFLLDFINKETR